MSKERNKAAAAAPPMDGQTAWTNGEAEPVKLPDTSEAPINPYAGFAEPVAFNPYPGDTDKAPDQSNAGGKRKGPRKPRTPAKTVVFVERLFSRFTLAQRKAMYAMLSSVCQPDVTEENTTGAL